MTCFLFGSDLVSALVGPFDSVDAAKAHAKFCEARGDAAVMRVVSEAKANRLRKSAGLVLTPEQDRAGEAW